VLGVHAQRLVVVGVAEFAIVANKQIVVAVVASIN